MFRKQAHKTQDSVLPGQVLIPKSTYNGQKPMMLVSTNTPATTSRTMASVPVNTFVKYNTAMAAAIINRIRRSAVPEFFLIAYGL